MLVEINVSVLCAAYYISGFPNSAVYSASHFRGGWVGGGEAKLLVYKKHKTDLNPLLCIYSLPQTHGWDHVVTDICPVVSL